VIYNHLRQQGRQQQPGQVIGNPSEHGLTARLGQNDAWTLEWQGVKVSIRYSKVYDQWTAHHVNPFGSPIRFGSGGYYSAGTTVKALVEDVKAGIAAALLAADSEAETVTSPPPSVGCPDGLEVPW
jgi:hypothetical protein